MWNPLHTGEFYSSEQVAQTLLEIAQKKQYRQIRISGGEPTLGKRHLLEVLRFIPEHYLFILETNGLLLGADVKYCKDLSVFENLHVRVCLKGADAEEFSLLTGAKDGFQYQKKAVEFLSNHQMNFHIALMSMDIQKKKRFYEWLREMNLGHIMIEAEEITLYPQVRKRLQERHLLEYFL